ncbi:hypothetical protein M3J09_012096 [Ascochyta lentis]
MRFPERLACFCTHSIPIPTSPDPLLSARRPNFFPTWFGALSADAVHAPLNSGWTCRLDKVDACSAWMGMSCGCGHPTAFTRSHRVRLYGPLSLYHLSAVTGRGIPLVTPQLGQKRVSRNVPRLFGEFHRLHISSKQCMPSRNLTRCNPLSLSLSLTSSSMSFRFWFREMLGGL